MSEAITTKDIPWDEKEEITQKEVVDKITYVQPKAPIQLSKEQRKFNQAMQTARTLASSSIVPIHFRGKPDDIFACMMLGSELGFKPMMALNSIVVIQGNATLKAQTMLAVVRARCPNAIIQITQEGDEVSCFAARDKDDLGYKASWSFQKGIDSGFATAWDKELKKIKTKDNWQKQPLVMCRWRAISEALRVVFPDILMGVYSTEEIMDSDIGEKTTQKAEDHERARQASLDFQE